MEYTYFQENWYKLLDPTKKHLRVVPELEEFVPDAKTILCFVPVLTTATWYRAVQPFVQVNIKHKEKYNVIFSTWLEAAPAIHKRTIPFDYQCAIFKGQDSAEALHAMQALKKSGIKIIYETDDDLFNIPSWNPVASKVTSSSKHVIKQMIKAADHLVVSTQPLKELYSWWHAPSSIDVIPNGVDLDLFGRYAKTSYPTDKVVIGWTGAAAHLEDLRIIKDVITKLLEDHSNVTFLLGGWLDSPFFNDIPEDRIIRVPWTNDLREHYQTLSKIDIGLCPLSDIKFNKGKSNLKAIELSAMGVVPVCSKVYPYEQTITDGTNGFLVDTNPKTWYNTISTLIKDHDLRKRVSLAAQENIRNNYTQDQATQKWMSLWQKLLP